EKPSNFGLPCAQPSDAITSSPLIRKHECMILLSLPGATMPGGGGDPVERRDLQASTFAFVLRPPAASLGGLGMGRVSCGFATIAPLVARRHFEGAMVALWGAFGSKEKGGGHYGPFCGRYL